MADATRCPANSLIEIYNEQKRLDESQSFHAMETKRLREWKYLFASPSKKHRLRRNIKNYSENNIRNHPTRFSDERECHLKMQNVFINRI